MADKSAGTSFASGLSRRANSASAASDVASQALSQLQGPPDVALLFFSADHVPHATEVAQQLVAELGTECLLGCSGESIVGVGQEVESEPAMSLWLARLPGSRLLPMKLEFVRTSEGGSIIGWPDDLLDEWPDNATLLVLGDPFSFPVDLLLEELNTRHAGTPVAGGMASVGQQPGENRLVFGRQVYREGAVAIWMQGDFAVRSIVSQGCRPIGEHYVITQSERNVIEQLGGLPAYRRLEELFLTLPTTEQRLVQRGLHVGRVVNEYQDRFEQGDFLVRNVVGVDPDAGSIAIADYVRRGQTMQFQVRDAASADAELRQLLSTARDNQPAAALLFTCNGRGTRLFREPHHDASVLREQLGPIPVAGFFAAGELGPIGGKNYLHGFTASIVLFEPLPG